MEGAVGACCDAEAEAVQHAKDRSVPRLKVAPPLDEGLTRLHFHSHGAIGNLFVEPLPALAAVRVGEVVLRVRAVGLNFRDVLNVLGEYPGEPGPPGNDASGMVLAIGSMQAPPPIVGVPMAGDAAAVDGRPVAAPAVASEV